MIPNRKEDFIWKFHMKFSGLSTCSFGIVDYSIVWRLRQWREFLGTPENTVGFFFNKGNLYYNIRGKKGIKLPILGGPLWSEELIILRYDAGKDSMFVKRPSKGLEVEFITAWSTYANHDSEFYLMFDCFAYWGVQINLQLIE